MVEQGWQATVDRLRADVDAVLALDVAGLEVTEVDALRRSLRRATDQLQAVAARLLARVEEDGRWSAGGTRTFGQWVARRDLTSVGAARREAELGRALGSDLPVTARAVASGDLTLEHARVLARLAPTSQARRAALAGTGPAAGGVADETALVRAATRMPVDRFRREVGRWAATVDRAAHERSHERALAAEHLTVTRREDGLSFQGFLTHEHGAVLVTALRAVAGVPASDDGRSREQRQAAALSDLARLVLDRGLAGGGAQVRPHLSVHVSWESLQRLTLPPADDASAPVEPATFDDGTPLPPSVLARLVCDSEISRIVFGPTGEVLDVGRAQRTYTGQLRRAVIARDRTCRYPGCDAPPTLCEIHHITYWGRGGVTSVENGILLCWFHHDQVHRRGLRISRGAPAAGPAEAGERARPWQFSRPDEAALAQPGPGAPQPESTRDDTGPPGPEQPELHLTG